MARGKRVKASKNKIIVVPFKSGEKVELGGGSFSDLLITSSTVSGNKTMMGYSVFKPGINTKQKIHLSAEELAYIVSGSGKITVGRKNIRFKQGDSLYIPAGMPHGVKNDGKEDVVMVFFFSSALYPSTVDA
ncbi:MAG TPA: cupin domain-containing protein [Nitrososphaerales archaeon]|nr:cupin domain-containing protein [Nitrososphaerales archaeon]